MIHDYKSNFVKIKRPRRRARVRLLVFVAAAAVVSTAFFLRHGNLEARQNDIYEANGPIIRTLDLPARPPSQNATSLPKATDSRPKSEGTISASTHNRQRPTTGLSIDAAQLRTPSLSAQADSGNSAKLSPGGATDLVAAAEDLAETPTIEQEQAPIAHAAVEPESVPASMSIATPAIEPPSQSTVAVETPLRTLKHQIQRGNTLAKIFDEADLSPSLLHRVVNSSKTASGLARIRPGQTLYLKFDDNNELAGLTLQRNKVSSLHVVIEADEITATEHRADLKTQIAEATGTIESSLFVDGQKAGLDDELIMELAAIFGWDIDFALEIRAGDRFSVVYEELFLGDEKIRNGDILAAEFVNRGVEHRAIRFAASDEEVAYYDPQGRNKRRAFIRTPVKFARVSSRFTNRRWHPVLKKWRSHKGVDYAAPTGTPIKASGAGRVVFKGRKGGYGRVIFIEHAQKYTTVYGHMSRFAKSIKTGSRVKQGQVIGYVGKSGLATGPHLHYEFRVNGVHRNPLTVKLPKSLPLPKRKLAAFRRETQPLLAVLDRLSQDTLIAEAATTH